MGKTLVLGMGNTIRGDDGVGIKITEALKGQIDFSFIEIKQTHESGINLLDKIAGYEKVIIIDSIKSESGKIGDIYRLNLLEKGLVVKVAPNFASSACGGQAKFGVMPYSLHNIGLPEILNLAGGLIDTPKEVIIYAVNTRDNDSFSDKMSSKIKKVIPKAVELVKKELAGLKGGKYVYRDFRYSGFEVSAADS